jgi:hypothetical protein
MSRQNKVNPGIYTQRGRLAQDDAAREIAKQRSVGSEHTWQPVQRDHEPRPTSEFEGDEDETTDTAAANKKADRIPARVAKKPAAARKTETRKSAKKTATPAGRVKARTGAAKPKTKVKRR